MATSEVDDFLAHFGVKGMKWGQRRSKAQLSKARANQSEDAKEAYSAKDKAKKSGVASLSNKELQSVNTRMSLEKNYKDLTTHDKKSGLAYVNSTLKVAGTAKKVYDLSTSKAGEAAILAAKAAYKKVK